eukprot:1797913-Alexandrium_andersonii.AAC.1
MDVSRAGNSSESLGRTASSSCDQEGALRTRSPSVVHEHHVGDSGNGAGVLRPCSPAEARGRTGTSLANEGALRGRSPSEVRAH